MKDQTFAVRIFRIGGFVPAEESETGEEMPILDQIAEIVDLGWAGLDQVAEVIDGYVNDPKSYDEEGGIYPLIYMMPVAGEDPAKDSSWDFAELDEVTFDLLRKR